MAQSKDGTGPDGYFNNLTQQPDDITNDDEPMRRNSSDGNGATNADRDLQPKAKRIACVLCRKRKLKCDGARPTCGTCKRLSHDCAYDEVRKKSGPKRGYVKLLEARLQQVETLLKSQDPTEQPQHQQRDQYRSSLDGSLPNLTTSIPPNTLTSMGPNQGLNIPSLRTSGTTDEIPPDAMDPDVGTSTAFSFADMSVLADAPMSTDSFPWEMIGLGLEEPLPPQDTIDDLHRIFFEKIYPSCPILHRGRYLAACNLSPQMRPSIALRYAMWCNAASATDKYEALAEHFYLRSRKYAQIDEMKGHGESIISIQHCQTWVFLTLYEFKNMYFPRAWQSTGRGVRMAQMLGLQRVDGAGLDVKQCLPPPKDWIEREECRRTFWLAFCEDRYASVGTGWPMTIDERDILTNLPASDDSFINGKPEQTFSLEHALKPSGASKLSSISGVILLSCMFGRNLTHLHRPTPDDADSDLNGEFWRRHRRIEGILSHTGLSLPDHLRLPAGLPDPNVVFLNMAIHTSAICLHQAAIFKADKHKLHANVGSESRVRCVTAAAEIARIMRMLSTLDLSTMNPFLAFCLYVAARVFIQYLKFRPKDEQMIASLQFLLAAMNALKRKNPLTESFLVQLDVDLEGMGIDVGQQAPNYSKISVLPKTITADSMKCSPLFDIRNSQSDGGTFGTGGIASHSQPTKSGVTATPGPPFHVAQTNLNLDVDPSSFGYFSNSGSADSPQYQLPNRNRSQHSGRQQSQTYGSRVGTIVDSLSPSASDEGRSPASINAELHATRSNSYKDNSSHTSFTPPSNDDGNQSERVNSPSRMGSTSSFTSGNRMPSRDLNYYNGMDTSFANYQNGFFPTDGSGVLPMQTGWEMSGIEITTGLTPMADQPWSEMLDGVQDWTGTTNFDQSIRRN